MRSISISVSENVIICTSAFIFKQYSVLYTLGFCEVTLPDYISKINLHSDVQYREK